MIANPHQAFVGAAIAVPLLLAPLPAHAVDDAPAFGYAELLVEHRYSIDEHEIALAVTRDDDGEVVGDATIRTPASSDVLEVWTDGRTIWWDGNANGAEASGSIPTATVLDPDDPQASFCLQPVGALVCLAGLAVLVALEGCGYGFGCSGELPPSDPTNFPGGDGSAPGGAGGGGDAEGDDDGGG
jgi:hypothetical protein